jgi:hypothetical protein
VRNPWVNRCNQLRATNTRFLDSLCRLFACDADDLIRMAPERPRAVDHVAIDRYAEADLERGRGPSTTSMCFMATKRSGGGVRTGTIPAADPAEVGPEPSWRSQGVI